MKYIHDVINEDELALDTDSRRPSNGRTRIFFLSFFASLAIFILVVVLAGYDAAYIHAKLAGVEISCTKENSFSASDPEAVMIRKATAALNDNKENLKKIVSFKEARVVKVVLRRDGQEELGVGELAIPQIEFMYDNFKLNPSLPADVCGFGVRATYQ